MNDFVKRLLIVLIITIVLMTAIIAVVAIKLKQSENRLTIYQKQLDVSLMLITELSDLGNGVKAHGRLQVVADELRDKNNEVVQLRGISTHGLTWYYEYTNANAFKSILDNGGNIVRLAVYSQYYDNDMLNMIFMAIENAIAMDMYVMVDWHVLKEQDPNVYIDKAMVFFERISQKYANESALIYELCNEPNGTTSWSSIKEYVNKIIPIIRNNDQDAIVLVGTPNFSTDLKSAINDPLDHENVMYSYHQYTNTMSNNDFKMIKDAKAAGLCVFVSEWGFDNRGSDMNDDKVKAEAFLDFLDDNKISWINWSLTNKQENSAALNPNTDKLGNWQLLDLSFSGQFVFERLAK